MSNTYLTINNINKITKTLNGGEITNTIKKGQVKRVGDRIYRAKKDIENFSISDVLDSTKFKPTYIGDSLENFKTTVFENQMHLYRLMYYYEVNGHKIDNNFNRIYGDNRDFTVPQLPTYNMNYTHNTTSSSPSYFNGDHYDLPINVNNSSIFYNDLVTIRNEYNKNYRRQRGTIRGIATNTISTHNQFLNNINNKLSLYEMLRRGNIGHKDLIKSKSSIETYEVNLLNLEYINNTLYKILIENEVFDVGVYRNYDKRPTTHINFEKLLEFQGRDDYYNYRAEQVVERYEENIGSSDNPKYETRHRLVSKINISPISNMSSIYNFNNNIRFWLPYFRDINQYDYVSNSARLMNDMLDNKYGICFIAKENGNYILDLYIIKTNKEQHDENYFNDRYAYIPGNNKITGTNYSNCTWFENNKIKLRISFSYENDVFKNINVYCEEEKLKEFIKIETVENLFKIQVFYAIHSVDDHGEWNEWQFMHLIAPLKVYYSQNEIKENEEERFDEIYL